MVEIFFGDGGIHKKYIFYSKKDLKLIKKHEGYNVYRALLTDGFVERSKENEESLYISYKGNKFKCKIEKSSKIYHQEGFFDEEIGFNVILFPMSYYNISVYMNT